MGIKARDELYKIYDETQFKDLNIDINTDPELHAFVRETREKGPKFSNYSQEKIEHFIDRIYELRKNNSNNSSGQNF
jgi:hypothetical protein